MTKLRNYASLPRVALVQAVLVDQWWRNAHEGCGALAPQIAFSNLKKTVDYGAVFRSPATWSSRTKFGRTKIRAIATATQPPAHNDNVKTAQNWCSSAEKRACVEHTAMMCELLDHGSCVTASQVVQHIAMMRELLDHGSCGCVTASQVVALKLLRRLRTDAMFCAAISPALVKHHMSPTTRPGGGMPYCAKSAKTDQKIGARPMPLMAAPVHNSQGADMSVPDKMISTWPAASTGSAQSQMKQADSGCER